MFVPREVAAECERPVLLFSGGKDSAVLLRLAQKAFRPGRFPFPVLHVDTGHNFDEVLEYRDKRMADLGEELLVASVQDSIDRGAHRTPVQADRSNRLQSVTLLDAIAAHGFDACIGGARRDEDKAWAKERMLSVRDAFGQWDPRNQRAELWHLYHGRLRAREHLRTFPLSDWTELDIWQYVPREEIAVPSIYFAHERHVPPKIVRDLDATSAGSPIRPSRPASASASSTRLALTPRRSCRWTPRWTSARSRLDPAAHLGPNDIGVVRLAVGTPLAVDPYRANRVTGSFVVIDEQTNATVAAGDGRRPRPRRRRPEVDDGCRQHRLPGRPGGEGPAMPRRRGRAGGGAEDRRSPGVRGGGDGGGSRGPRGHRGARRRPGPSPPSTSRPSKSQIRPYRSGEAADYVLVRGRHRGVARSTTPSTGTRWPPASGSTSPTTPRVAASCCPRWHETARSLSRCRRRVPAPRWRDGCATESSRPWAPASEIWRRCSRKVADASTIRAGAPRRSTGERCSTGRCRTWSARGEWTRRGRARRVLMASSVPPTGERPATGRHSRARNALIGNTLPVGPTETAAAARPRKRSLPSRRSPRIAVGGSQRRRGDRGDHPRQPGHGRPSPSASLAGNPDDVTLPQYRTLVVLTFGGPSRLADLAEALSVSPSTATRMCDRLVRKNLVSRTRDELDRREVKLAITPLGRKVVSDVIDRRRAEVRDLLEAIPVPLRRQLVSSLTLLAAAAGRGARAPLGTGLVLGARPGDPDVFASQNSLIPESGELPAVARALRPAEGQLDGGRHHGVHEDHPGVEALDEQAALVVVARPHTGPEPERGVVGHPQRVGGVLRLVQQSHGREHLLGVDAHRRCDPGEDSRKVEEPRAFGGPAPAQHRGALGAGVLDLPVHVVAPLGRGQGPDVGAGFHGVPDDQPPPSSW